MWIIPFSFTFNYLPMQKLTEQGRKVNISNCSEARTCTVVDRGKWQRRFIWPTSKTMRRLVLTKNSEIVLVDGRSQACHFSVFSRPVAFLLLISLHIPTLLALKTPKNENDMFATFRLPKRSHNPSLVPVSSSFNKYAMDSTIKFCSENWTKGGKWFIFYLLWFNIL